MRNRGSHEGGLHPCLYPILLLLSKMRPAAEEVPITVSPFNSEIAEEVSNEQDTKCEFSRLADISLFVPLVESCRGQASQKVREMAAKALCPLIPLRAAPLKAAALLLGLNESLDIQSGNTVSFKISHNELHGTLSLCYEVLDSLKRRMAGVGDNKVFLSLLQDEISRVLLPQLARMLTLLSAIICPSLHIVFLRILRTILTLLSNYDDTSSSNTAVNIAKCLLLGECRVVLRPILHSINSGQEEKDVLPYEPVLYREAGLDLTFLSLQWSSRNRALAAQAEEDEKNSPFSTYPVSILLSLLSHPLSEVREGVLLGCLKAVSLTSSTAADSSDNSQAVKQFLQSTGLFEILLQRAAKELEPPLRSLSLQLICR